MANKGIVVFTIVETRILVTESVYSCKCQGQFNDILLYSNKKLYLNKL